MNQLGWLEGKNYTIEQRFGEGKGLDRLAEFAADLLRLNVDVILTSATSAALAAKKATREIPIVMASVGDPVGQGIVTSLARPGGNITGLSSLAGELGGKRLEILKETTPQATRIGVLMGSTKGRGGQLQLKEIGAAAAVRIGDQSQCSEANGPNNPAAGAGASGQSDQIGNSHQPIANSKSFQLRKSTIGRRTRPCIVAQDNSAK